MLHVTALCLFRDKQALVVGAIRQSHQCSGRWKHAFMTTTVQQGLKAFHGPSGSHQAYSPPCYTGGAFPPDPSRESHPSRQGPVNNTADP